MSVGGRARGVDADAIVECVHYSQVLAQRMENNANITHVLWNVIPT